MNQVAVEELSKKYGLTFDQAILAASKLMGYRELPPTIEQFIEDDYYLGRKFSTENNGLYPYWKEQLMDMYPTPIHTRYPFLVLTGAIGTGKSTFSKICGLYNECRLSYLDNLKFFNIASTKSVVWVWFHKSAEQASSDFIESNGIIKSESPFFHKLAREGRMIPVEHRADGPRSNKGIGGDIIFYNMSELNFVPYGVAWDKINTAFKRWDSRFKSAYGNLGNIILDTSSRGDDSITEDFIKSNPYKIHTLRSSHYKVKRHTGQYYNGGTFLVYTGDAQNKAFILDSEKSVDDQLTDTMDKDRLEEVPDECLPHFKFDIITSLQDISGISTTSTGKWLPDPTTFVNSCCIKQYHPDIIDVDFYDLNDKLINYLIDQINALIPRESVIFPSVDLAVTGDLAGFAITHLDKMISSGDNDKVQIPVFRTPLTVGVSRKSNQETSIFHFNELIQDLNRIREIGEFSSDTYQSRQLLQDLTRDGIPCKAISVDRTDSEYIQFKNIIQRDLWTGVKNQILINEGCGLRHLDGKVDHGMGDSDPGKDLIDATCRSYISCHNNLRKAQELSNLQRVINHQDTFKLMMASKISQLQSMIEGYTFGI